jgi:hypothetical protein
MLIYFFLVLFGASVHGLQFVRVTSTSTFMRSGSSSAVAMDFTVYKAVLVSALGVLDAGQVGLVGTLTAQIVDRSNDRVVVGPVTFNSGDARTGDSNPFAFKNVTNTRLEPGVYSLMSVGFESDALQSTQNGDAVLAGDSGDGAILITAAGEGGTALLPSTLTRFFPGGFVAGATFLFTVAAASAPTPLSSLRLFRDCEEVACAGLATGDYNVSGQVRFCDNNAAGGGWMRLWRANDSTCEENGWSSARNVQSAGSRVDPRGCRPATGVCAARNTTASPFDFREVRGADWAAWVLGTPDGVHVSRLCDGMIVRGSGGNVVWAFPVALSTEGEFFRRCPCAADFTNSTLTVGNLNTIGPFFTCDRVEFLNMSQVWQPLFNVPSPFLCTSVPGVIAQSFRRVLTSPHRILSVSICKDQEDINEDLKLASGDLFVRATPGFSVLTHCPTTTTAATTTTATTTTATTRAATTTTTTATTMGTRAATTTTTATTTTATTRAATPITVALTTATLTLMSTLATTQAPTISTPTTTTTTTAATTMTTTTTMDTLQQSPSTSIEVPATTAQQTMLDLTTIADEDDTVLIAGAVGGGLCALLLLGTVVLVVCRSRKKSTQEQQQEQHSVSVATDGYGTLPSSFAALASARGGIEMDSSREMEVLTARTLSTDAVNYATLPSLNTKPVTVTYDEGRMSAMQHAVDFT